MGRHTDHRGGRFLTLARVVAGWLRPEGTHRGRKGVAIALGVAILTMPATGLSAPKQYWLGPIRKTGQPSIPGRVGTNSLVSPSGSGSIFLEPTATYDPGTHNNHYVGFSVVTGQGVAGASTTNSGGSWSAASPSLALPAYAGEPSAAYDASHDLFYSFLSTDAQGGTEAEVSELPTGSTNWSTPAIAETSANLPDKQSLAIDLTSGGAYSHPNRLYLAYDEVKSTTSQPIVVAHSDDGASWSSGAKVQLYDSGGDTSPVDVVGPSGEVYVLWDDFKTGAGRLLLEKSTDGGGTFSALGTSPVVVASTGIGFGTTLTNYGKSGCASGQRLVGPSAALAVDRSGGSRNGWLYAVWADLPSGASRMHVYFSYSSNAGSTWSSPIQLDFDNFSNDAWDPSVAVDQSDGKVAVAWYDRRDDPNNKLYDLYYTESFTGTSFPTQIPVSSAQSDPTVDCNGTGTTTALIATDGTAYPFWTDTRSGTNQIYTAAVAASFGLGHTWNSLPGSATDVSVSVGANGSVWVIGTTTTTGGYQIWSWTGSSWKSEPGGAVRIAVDPNGNPWVINNAQQIFYWVNGNWQLEPGSAYDIGVGSNGTVDMVSTTPKYNGYAVEQWTGSGWSTSNTGCGGGTRIAVDNSGAALLVNSIHEMWIQSGNCNYTRVSTSANDVGGGADGSVWIVTNTAGGDGYEFALWYGGTNWQTSDGSGSEISVAPNGAPWITQQNNLIWYRS